MLLSHSKMLYNEKYPDKWIYASLFGFLSFISLKRCQYEHTVIRNNRNFKKWWSFLGYMYQSHVLK